MTKNTETSKEYRILQGFNYFGKDGKDKKSVRIGPGESVPELNDIIKKDLLSKLIICEVDPITGENSTPTIINKDGRIVLTPLAINQYMTFNQAHQTIHMLQIDSIAEESLLLMQDKVKEYFTQGLARKFPVLLELSESIERQLAEVNSLKAMENTPDEVTEPAK